MMSVVHGRRKATFMRSFLSMCRAHITMIMYSTMREIIVENTAAFSPRLLNLAQTLVKSMVLGGTTASEPKDVRCVHRHWVFHRDVSWPT